MSIHSNDDALAKLEELRHLVFGSSAGDEPDIYKNVDYDDLCKLSREVKEAIEFLRRIVK